MSIIPFPTTRRTLPGFSSPAVHKQPVKSLDHLLRDTGIPACSSEPAPKRTLISLWCELTFASPPDTLVFIQVGDFHETFMDHAKTAAPILNVALTKRQDVPMCGIPVHAEDTYFKRLLEVGKTILLGTRGEDGNFHITRTLSPPTLVPPNAEPLIIQCQKEFLALPDGYQPGAIIDSSWGYDQTNIDFYRIEKRTGLMVILAPLQSTLTETVFMSGDRLPTATPKDYLTDHDVAWGNKDKENPKPTFRRKLRLGKDGTPSGLVISHGWASLWNGKPVTCSCYA